jgi:aminomuconate-semialdehyde/2-hydroxymuconate-6-semialdehyde dehydrogenase
LNIYNYINGEFTLPVSGNMLDNLNPATGQIIAKIPDSNYEDVAKATEAAKLALPNWRGLTKGERINWLNKIAQALEERSEDIAKIESMDTGKPIALARRVDAARSISNFRFFAKHAEQLSENKFTMADATNYVIRKPVGVVGLITPWNLPLYLLSWKIAPALVMGNTIVAKPSEMTPMTANLLAKTLDDIDFPTGVVNIVHGLGPSTGQAILEHPEISAISFTGGTETGKIVAKTAGPMFKKLSLELGGKNATIILDDADLETAAIGAAKAAFTNSGQVCLCGSRVLIDAKIYDAFVDKFVVAVAAMKVGNPEDESTDIGSVISQQHMEKVLSYIELAKQEGGTITHGGQRIIPNHASLKNGSFISPTVIENLSISSRCATEEIFGPVVTLHKFYSDLEAIEMTNSTQYGLAGSIWTSDTVRGKQFAKQIDSGILWVNTWLHRDLRTPFGGVKNSGVGREGGDWSLNFFSELSNICVKDD